MAELSRKKKWRGKPWTDGDLKQWGLIDVGDKTYAMAFFRRNRKIEFLVWEFDEDGVVHVQPVSRWRVTHFEIWTSHPIIYKEMSETIATGYYDIYELRDTTLRFMDDVYGKRGDIPVYGYCA